MAQLQNKYNLSNQESPTSTPLRQVLIKLACLALYLYWGGDNLDDFVFSVDMFCFLITVTVMYWFLDRKAKSVAEMICTFSSGILFMFLNFHSEVPSNDWCNIFHISLSGRKQSSKLSDLPLQRLFMS